MVSATLHLGVWVRMRRACDVPVGTATHKSAASEGQLRLCRVKVVNMGSRNTMCCAWYTLPAPTSGKSDVSARPVFPLTCALLAQGVGGGGAHKGRRSRHFRLHPAGPEQPEALALVFLQMFC